MSERTFTGGNIPDLPEHWASVTVGDAGDVRVGRQRSPNRQTGEHATKYLRAANITTRGLDLADVFEMDFTPSEREVFALRTGDILLAEASGSASQVGRSAVWSSEIPDCCFQNTVIRFRPTATLTSYATLVFRFYFVTGQFRHVARGVGIQHLSGRRFSSMPFPLPPMEEQARIAEHVNPKVKELYQAEGALVSALSRIGEQTVQILAAGATGQLGRSAHLGGGSLPEHWEESSIGEVGEVRLGKGLKGEDSRRPNSQYLRVANVHEDAIDTTDLNEMYFSNEELTTYALEPGDILLNEGQSKELVGRPAIVRDDASGLLFQNSLIRFRASARVIPEFALLVFRHYLHSGAFSRVAKRSTNIAHLGRARFASMPFPVPPIDEQSAIVNETRARLAASDEELRAVTAARERLSTLEIELLTMAMTGQLSSPEVGDSSAYDLIKSPSPLIPNVLSRDNRVQRHGARQVLRQSDDVERGVRGWDVNLAEILRDGGGSLTATELFARAGYQRNSSQDVEQFYLKLREAMGTTLRAKSDGEDALIEVILSAS